MTRLTHLRLAKLPADGPHQFDWQPSDAERAAMIDALGLLDLRKMRATLTVAPRGKSDWHLTAKWGATVVQPCVVTLDPVTTRLEQTDTLQFTARMPEITETEAEMPEDETLEPLTEEVEIAALLQEMVALALPPYPRADGAELGTAIYTAPGEKPMTDDDAKPFAGLAALKSKLESPENGD
ncbi:MAG: DUF177 domain-containing protein [Pseudomonadota bacterium]